MKVHQGTIDQGNLELTNYGKICCPASITACFMAMYLDPKFWTTEMIDDCVKV